MASSSSFVNLLASQGSVDLDSAETPLFSTQSPQESSVKERRKCMGDEVDRILNATLDKTVDEYFEDTYNNIVKNQTKKQSKRAYVERNREESHTRLWTDYFSENLTFPPHLFRRRFRMNKARCCRKIRSISTTNVYSISSYGCAADAVDEYLRLGESTTLSCLSKFTEGVIQLFGDEYLRRPTPEDLQRLLDIGEIHGFPGMIGSIACTLNDINVLDWSPVFDDILQGRAPRVQYVVNGHQYDLAYYLTDGIYQKWSTFIQSILNPQGPEAELFAKVQEATRKDVERAFGVLQARVAIVKNPAIL
ncbi:uncharacterized protein LOC106350791 [Brassica napus]|uniref:uncharacterized protein LOC106350791 n=1 Tax=Brassica napus TaxID=3708 RepID=UPI00207930F6|nr:uncharacterized protein LOC106350791 [Brassica napus]